MTQETLEEASYNYAKHKINKTSHVIGFREGAKWQQQQMYSEPKGETLEDDFMVWDELFGILAWKFKPTKSGDMFIDSEKVFEELKSKFKLKKK